MQIVYSDNSNNSNNQFKYHFKLFLAGYNGTGKTSILERFSKDVFYNLYGRHTIAADFIVKNLEVDGMGVQIQLWDQINTGYHTDPKLYFRGLHSIIFVYDVKSIESFNYIKNHWYIQFSKYYHEKVGYRVSGMNNYGFSYNGGFDYQNYIPQIFIFGSRCDLRNQYNYQRCVDFDMVREYSKTINAIPFEVSSKDNISIKESIHEIIFNLIINHETFINNNNNNNNINNNNSNNNSSTKSNSYCNIN